MTKYKKQKVVEQQCKQVPWRNCYNVPEQQCEWVVENQCQSVPQKQCVQVPHKQCQDVHKKVPRNKTRKIPINSCQTQGTQVQVRPRVGGAVEENTNQSPWENGSNVREFDLTKVKARTGIDSGLNAAETGGAISFE